MTENQPPSCRFYDIIRLCSVQALTNNQAIEIQNYFYQIIKNYTFLTVVLSCDDPQKYGRSAGFVNDRALKKASFASL